MKLRTKIQLFSSLFMFILIVLINTSIYVLFYKVTSNNELDQLSEQTHTILETLNANPDIPKRELLNAFLPANSMIRLYEENTDEPMVVITKHNEYRSLQGGYSSEESRSIMTDDATDTPIAVIAKPIIWENGQIVTLEISEHLVSLQKTMSTLFYVLLVASLLMLIPTMIAGNILSRFLLRPIQTLTRTMKQNTTEGHWEKINVDNRTRDELYDMEKTFNEMIDQLKESFDKQEVFVSDASHELKTPIAIIKSYAQLMKRQGKERPEVVEESIEAIDTEADRMQKLVEQMLSLAKSGETHTLVPIDFLKVCEDVVHVFQGAYERQIIFDLPTGHFFVAGNLGQLKQIVYILLDNAIKYSDSEIIVQLSRRGEEAILQVIDDGQGIPVEEQKLIFDRFYRVDQARSRDTGGTGLGLAIAQSIAKIHQGKLSVNSKQGEGSTFTLQIPILKES